jgi:hypothetical protein
VTSFHTLPYPAYSPYLTDGTKITTLAGLNITVTRSGGDIWFNDAKVISPNVLTNNGIIHVLDKVMSPNGTAPVSSPTPSATQSTSTASSPTTSQTTSSTSKPNSANSRFDGNGAAIGLVGFIAAAALI